jgi:hypothetical protein
MAGHWHDDPGESGLGSAWKTGLSAENQALHEDVNSKRLDPEMKAWAEHGRTAYNASNCANAGERRDARPG